MNLIDALKTGRRISFPRQILLSNRGSILCPEARIDTNHMINDILPCLPVHALLSDEWQVSEPDVTLSPEDLELALLDAYDLGKHHAKDPCTHSGTVRDIYYKLFKKAQAPADSDYSKAVNTLLEGNSEKY